MIQPQRLVHHLIFHDQEKKLIAQIYGWVRETLVQTAIDIEKKYPEFMGIELNIGCPSPKVMSCGWGSGMMREKERTLSIIKEISESVSCPFSIKVRTWINEDDKQDRYNILLQAAPYVHCISIHGRTIKQGHSGEVDWEYIRKFKEDVGDTCIVIGNGGIKSFEEAEKRVKENKIDGAMIAQAAIANPWIFTPHTPSIKERYDVIKRHLYLSTAYQLWSQESVPENTDDLSSNKAYLHAFKKYDPNSDESFEFPPLSRHSYKVQMPTKDMIEKKITEISSLTVGKLHSVIEFRKYLFNYIKGLPWSKDLKTQVASINDFETLESAIDTYFTQLLTHE